MFNFKDVVSDILLEEELADTAPSAQNSALPVWFNNVLKKHNEIYGTNITETDLPLLWGLVAGKTYLADRDAVNNLDKIRILDLLMVFYNKAKVTDIPTDVLKDWYKFKATFLAQYKFEEDKEFLETIKKLTLATKEQWPIRDASVMRAYQKALAEGDKLSGAALTTYDANSIIQAVQQIVNKRINTFTRIAKLKNPKTPFGSLIQDIFKQPEPYLSGQKRYSSDFEAIDDLYIKDIIKVAIAAKEFYASEIAKLKMQQLEVSGFNLFKDYVNFILSEAELRTSAEIAMQKADATAAANKQAQRTNILKNTGQTRKATSKSGFAKWAKDAESKTSQPQQQEFNKKLFDELYDAALKDTDNRLNFLSGKPVTYNKVDNEGKQTGQQGTTDPKKYTVGNIRKMESIEARELIKTLQDIALYVKKKTGAGERLKHASAALDAVTGFAGATLYGGPQ